MSESAPGRIVLIPVTRINRQWVWDEHVRPRPGDIEYANEVAYIRADLAALDTRAAEPGERERTIEECALALREGATMNGIDQIRMERARQVADEGWTAEHDDHHDHREMAIAATCYALHGTDEYAPTAWPWAHEWWKPKDRISNLVRAGALIAAEIDRLQRAHTPTGRERP